MIFLDQPSVKYIDSFFPAMEEFALDGQPQVRADMKRGELGAYVERLLDLAAGRNLPEGYIPSKEFWMIDSDGYAGRIILGLTYYPSPERVGHHVGYAVRPSRRQRGYATQALKLLKEEARKLGIYRLNPTCSPDNIASRKVIEANGGELLPRTSDGEADQEELRFLIALKPEASLPE